MFSEYYGESGKVVDKVFAVIESMLDEDENTFICVLVDDIESLAGKRECCSSSNEPHDSLRVCVNTNYILVARSSLIKFRLSMHCWRRLTVYDAGPMSQSSARAT